MAELREVSQDELKKVIAEHKKWLESGTKEGSRAILREIDTRMADFKGVNLSRADFSRANLVGADFNKAELNKADFSGTNLLGANLKEASLKEVDLRSANLSGSNLCGADLTGAFLYRADLSGVDLNRANLSGAELRWADLSWVDLSASKLYKTKIREEDLSGVRYHPEQLKDMIIESSKKEPGNVPEQRGKLIIRLADDKPPILHLIYLFNFVEYQYDILYILLFSQDDGFDKLKDILSGAPYHWLKGKKEALRIDRVKMGSLEIALGGLNPIWIVIFAFVGYFLGKTDLLQSIVIILYKLQKKEFKEKPQVEIERIRTELIEKNKSLFETARRPDGAPDEAKEEDQDDILDLDMVQLDHLSPEEPEEPEEQEPLPDLFNMDSQPENKPARKDLLETVLFLRQEKLLTNKLSDQDVANLLEIHMENFGQEFQSIREQVGDFKVGLGKE